MKHRWNRIRLAIAGKSSIKGPDVKYRQPPTINFGVYVLGVGVGVGVGQWVTVLTIFVIPGWEVNPPFYRNKPHSR